MDDQDEESGDWGNDESDDQDQSNSDWSGPGGEDVQTQEPLMASPDGGSYRATGFASDFDRNEVAAGEAANGVCTDRTKDRDFGGEGFLTSLLEAYGKQQSDGTPQMSKDRDQQSGAAAGERISSWLGLDLGDPLGGFNFGLKTVQDFAGGTKDFLDRYSDMRAANTIGADKYFHCMANCEAASRGLGGLIAAETISVGREAVDIVKNVVKGGMTWEASYRDCADDLRADHIGLRAGFDGTRCYTGCDQFRVPGLDPKY